MPRKIPNKRRIESSSEPSTQNTMKYSDESEQTLNNVSMDSTEDLVRNIRTAEQNRQPSGASSAYGMQKIGQEQIRKASEILNKYKAGKIHLEQKIIADEEFWKLRQWRYETNAPQEEFKPASAWLWACIQSRYSDAMDSYPTCNMQPRSEDDVDEARRLSAIIPVILEQNRYEDTYSDIVWYTLKHGGSVQGVFWDGSKHGGKGDIAIKKIDYLNLFWEPGITDIQESSNIFNTELVDNEILEQRYPQTKGKLGSHKENLAKYIYNDNIDTSEKSCVVDWYYHTEYNGKKALHYVKYVDDIVLYATENDTEVPMTQQIDPMTGSLVSIPNGPSMAERGLYDHALYPFVAMRLNPVEGSLCGQGITDIGRDTQLVIDKLDKAIMDNALVGATPRYFSINDGSVNEEEFADLTKKIVHVEGSLSDDHLRVIDSPGLSGIYVQYYMQKVDELKYVTSNNDSSNGQTASGVTSGTAIAALQEAAGKNARSSNKTFYRAYRDVIYQVIELIRQFYDTPRSFRISPETAGGSSNQFVTYSNQGLVPQAQSILGFDMGYRLPEFDIEVTAEKADPYKKMEVNELAISFYQQGFFNPSMTDQALGALQMMDFKQKDKVMERIEMNGTLQQLMLQYQMIALQLAEKYDPEVAEQLSQMILQHSGEAVALPVPTEGGADLDGSESGSQADKARMRTRQSAEVD